jgi:hypothetical protein
MIRSWFCNACGTTDRTNDDGTGTRYHQCPKMRGLSVPFTLAGVKAKLTLHEWEDYVGKEMVQLDPERRRPVRSIVTERDDGQDCVVLAPTATSSAR